MIAQILEKARWHRHLIKSETCNSRYPLVHHLGTRQEPPRIARRLNVGIHVHTTLRIGGGYNWLVGANQTADNVAFEEHVTINHPGLFNALYCRLNIVGLPGKA
jgi:hypothetical protein